MTIDIQKQKLESIRGQLFDLQAGVIKELVITRGEWADLLDEAVAKQIADLTFLLDEGKFHDFHEDVGLDN
jgi:hypothetical protein